MSRKRLSKTQLKRDKFVEQTFDWAHWVETHRNQVIGGVVAAVLIVAGFFVWRNMQASAGEAAARDYLSARQAYDSGNWALAASDLQRVVNQHGGTAYGDDAMFFLASAQYRSGQMEPAIQTLRDFLDRHEDSGYADNARRLLVAAYQGLGQFDQAAEVYREAIEDARYEEVEVQLRGELADLYAAQNRRDLAADQYRQILELEPEGPIADRARREYAELTVQPLSGPAAPPEGEATGLIEDPAIGGDPGADTGASIVVPDGASDGEPSGAEPSTPPGEGP